MPIISTIERKTVKGRLGLGVIYLLLLVGAISTLYPFLLMLRKTTTDDIDKDSLVPIPEFWFDKDQTARKYLLWQYSIDMKALPWIYESFAKEDSSGIQIMKWEHLSQANQKSSNPLFKTDFWKENFTPLESIPREKLLKRIQDYQEFTNNANPWFIQPIFTYRPGRNFNNQWIQFYLAEKEKVSPKTYQYFESVRPQWTRRDWFPEFNENLDKWFDWIKNGLTPAEKMLQSADILWQIYLSKKYKNNILELRTAHNANYANFANGPMFSITQPTENPKLISDWKDFLLEYYPLLWQEIRNEYVQNAQHKWRAWLKEKYKISSVAEWNLFTGQSIRNDYEMDYTPKMPANDVAARWWCEFTYETIPVEARIVHSPENDFRSALKNKYSSIEKLNESWGTNFANFASVRFPIREADFYTLTEYSAGIKYLLTTGNYSRVIKMLALEGNAAMNTVIIVVLCLLTALTVNPLAAYALSRFRLKTTHRILIFLLATMALPAEIAMVPSFLLVKNLGLINTYFALILPHAANAFYIFLLKGFFDSLPAELYEAAMLDGANEFHIFFRITIPLSMPIISVKILNTTMMAYNMFMPVVIYITNQDMWPISTKIYEINQVLGGAQGMAALVLASIFPLLVFIFCQRLIMRGIILPSFK